LDTIEEILKTQPEAKRKKASKFPKTTLDFTITTKSIYGDLEAVFDKFKHPLSLGYRLKDVYVRPQDDGQTSYTLQFTIASHEKTLTADEINAVWQSIVDHGKKHNFIVDNT
jgi:phenylalanyl-tRNA synthetase beta subunit